ncbi:MAG: hypothetical protein LBO78_03555 [Rickettsiales bacterium]|nr:hypothetical protein [Rickettsiales bacterium]
MNHEKTIMIVLISLLSGSGGTSAASTGNFDALDKALETYCIPKCESGCSKPFLAEYKDGKCKCGANLMYDSGLRECVIKCPTGMYVHKGPGCPAGTYAPQGATCPAGSYKLGNTDEHGVMAAGTTCPSGMYTITIN